jgi:hypothetical protein
VQNKREGPGGGEGLNLNSVEDANEGTRRVIAGCGIGMSIGPGKNEAYPFSRKVKRDWVEGDQNPLTPVKIKTKFRAQMSKINAKMNAKSH